jgi:hypothetical protein
MCKAVAAACSMRMVHAHYARASAQTVDLSPKRLTSVHGGVKMRGLWKTVGALLGTAVVWVDDYPHSLEPIPPHSFFIEF